MTRTFILTGLRKLLIASAIAVATFGTVARADLLVYDPFSIGDGPGDYLAGDDSTGINVLATQNPVASPTPFYAGGWIQSGGDAQAVRQPGVDGIQELSYPKFPKAGGIVTDSLEFSCCSFGRSARQIAGGLGRGDARTIYQSFLVDFGNQGVDDPNAFGKRAVEWWNDGFGDSHLAVDLFVNSFNGTTDFTLQVTTPTGTSTSLLNGGGLNLANMAGTHLVVMKFEFNPADPINPLGTSADDDIVSVYLDPTDSIESNWTPAASISVNASDLLITHHGASTNFAFSGGGHHPARFDEVRWGDTFADVTPFVPEPTSLALVTFGLAALLPLRRLRKRYAPPSAA